MAVPFGLQPTDAACGRSRPDGGHDNSVSVATNEAQLAFCEILTKQATRETFCSWVVLPHLTDYVRGSARLFRWCPKLRIFYRKLSVFSVSPCLRGDKTAKKQLTTET